MQLIDVRDADRWEAVRELLADTEAFDGSPPVSDQAIIAARQGKRNLYMSDSAVGIVGEGEIDLVVHPKARGHGVGDEALRCLLDHHTAAEGGELRTWAHGQSPSADTLLRSAGFTPIRELLLMSLDPARLPDAISAARPLPAGFDIAAFDPNSDSNDAAEWVRVNAAAFVNHPEQGQVTLSDFEALQKEPWFDAADLRLAWVSPSQPRELAGSTWVKTTRGESGVATELYVLGVDPSFTGLGLGAALLGETLRRMRDHAPARITLYVDGDNLGARALYERAGFEVEQRSTQWLRSSANKR